MACFQCEGSILYTRSEQVWASNPRAAQYIIRHKRPEKVGGSNPTGVVFPLFLKCSSTQQPGRKTDDNGNAMLLSKLFKKESAEDTIVPPLWGKREKRLIFCITVHAPVRGGTCAITLKTFSALINDSSRDDRPSILA